MIVLNTLGTSVVEWLESLTLVLLRCPLVPEITEGHLKSPPPEKAGYSPYNLYNANVT